MLLIDLWPKTLTLKLETSFQRLNVKACEITSFKKLSRWQAKSPSVLPIFGDRYFFFNYADVEWKARTFKFRKCRLYLCNKNTVNILKTNNMISVTRQLGKTKSNIFCMVFFFTKAWVTWRKDVLLQGHFPSKNVRTWY